MFYFSNAYGHIDIFDDKENIDTISFFKVLKLVIKEKNAFIGGGDDVTENLAMFLNWLFSPFYSKDLRRRLKEVNKMTYNSRHLNDYVAVIHNGVIDFVLRKKLKEIKDGEYVCNLNTAYKYRKENTNIIIHYVNEQMKNWFESPSYEELFKHDN